MAHAPILPVMPPALAAVNPFYVKPPAKEKGPKPYIERLVGLVFARSDRRFVAEEILPSLDYYHARSKHHIDFRFAGYTRKNGSGRTSIGLVNGTRWYFDPRLFDEDRVRISCASNWTYSGETDLIALVERGGKLDWSWVLAANLEEWKDRKVIRSVSEFIEKLCSIAESTHTDGSGKTISALSDALSFRGALENGLRSVVPGSAVDQLKKALLSLTSDLRRK